MLPYLLWALLYTKFSVPNLMKISYGSYWSIASSGASSNLWFLPVMFMSLCLFYLFVKTGLVNRFYKKVLLMVICFVIGFFFPYIRIGWPWGIDVAFMACVFLLLGNIIQSYIGRLYYYPPSKKGQCISLLFFLLMFVGTLSLNMNNSSGVIVMMKNAQYGDCLFFILTAVFGTLMLLFLSMFIEYLNPNGYGWLSFIGQNTLCIFVIHKPIIGCFRVLFNFVQISESVILIITTAGTLLLSCLLCIMINKYAPVLAGR